MACPHSKRKYYKVPLAFLFIASGLVLMLLLNLGIGSVDIPLSEVWNILIGSDSENHVWENIVWKTRMPQTLTSVLAGAGLAVSGLQMQTIFRNPIAGPSVLGISSGASLGVAFVVLLSGNIAGMALGNIGAVGEMAITVSAIVGALGVMALIVFVSQRVRGNVTLLIIGVMIGHIANAVIGVLKYLSVEEEIRVYVIWGLGSFARVSTEQLYFFAIMMVVVLPLAMLQAKSLNMLLLGEAYARNLGLNIKRVRMYVITCAGVLVAIVTAYCGPIMFLGLAVPHLCRGFFRTSDHRILLPATMLTGALLALVCNLIARMPGFEGALPVNSVTALIGAPVVIYVLIHRQHDSE
jgi:iron complex transport system permease protein